MAQPQWRTLSSDLGIIADNEYYELTLDAYDPTGGGLTYKLISGNLPKGMRVDPAGKILGVPTIELDNNPLIDYKFTIRIINADKQIADKSFKLAVNNTMPPSIIPSYINLGRYLDGTYIDTNLVAIDQTPGAKLTWTVLSGTLPPGLTLNTNGNLSGYVKSISAIGPAGDPGWDDSSWDVYTTDLDLPWDFTTDLISKQYTFTIQVFDGVYTDVSTYTVQIVPRQDFLISDINDLEITADQTNLTLGYDFDTDQIQTIKLTTSETSKHNPIITTTQSDLIPVRQNSYFSFKFSAEDLDDDVLNYAITALDNSEFDQINIGFDTTKFSQTELSMPGPGLVLDEYSGWMTGRLPSQTINQVDYNFELSVYKRDNPEYITKQIFTLTVLGDTNDNINWLSPTELGSIENGNISEFLVSAISTTGKKLYYTLTPNKKKKLPQGLQLSSDGLIFGRVSFETFTLDSGTTTLDLNTTNFDSTYEFNVTASDLTNTVSSTKSFKLTVIPRNLIPYENLYLKAFPPVYQREQFFNIINDKNLFPAELIYRNSDPYFGLCKDLRFLFLAGLSPNSLSTYYNSINNNHYNKRIVLGEVKTAIALDTNFNIKYEVVYIDVVDPAATATGGNAADSIYINNTSDEHTLYPNGFRNMQDELLSSLNYVNKGALPDWMTSNQIDSNNNVLPSLGLTRGIVLAYTVPGGSKKIEYKLKNQLPRINFNTLDFTIDRYELDNNYSSNFDTIKSKFITSRETTFDRFFGTTDLYNDKGAVLCALSVPYDTINGKYVSEIQQNGGLDGVMNFNDGDLIIFAKQQYLYNITQGNQIISVETYNYGWNNVLDSWDELPWAYNSNISDSDNTDPIIDHTPGEPWNNSNYIPGYFEHLNLGVQNIRAGIWKININNNFVTLTLYQEMNYFDKVEVYDGSTYANSVLFFDPAIKPGNEVPEYSYIPKLITRSHTTFDGNGTRFLSNRDLPTIPELGDKYIKFAKIGVFT